MNSSADPMLDVSYPNRKPPRVASRVSRQMKAVGTFSLSRSSALVRPAVDVSVPDDIGRSLSERI